MPREQFRLPEWFDRDAGLNPAVLEALWTALQRTDPDLAVAMLYLTRAAGKHLDAHGALYGVTRYPRESDIRYRKRILARVLNPRSTAEAIERVIETAMPGVLATVVPPTPNASYLTFDGTWTLDGTEFFTSKYAGVPLAQFDVILDAEEAVNLTRARALIEDIRAAGYIPTVATLTTFDAVFDATLGPGDGVSGTSQLVERPHFNGFRDFDGTWTFSTNALGAPVAL